MLRDDDEIKLQYLLVRIVPYQAFFEGGHPLENRGLGSTLSDFDTKIIKMNLGP
jgi:hypothetical protein